jgi:hypothetical protein
MMVSENLQYPIGKYKKPDHIDAGQRERFIQEIAAAPKELRKAVEGLDDAQLNTPYREGGWTVRQVVHHLPDSHMNGYVRLKLALTEHEPDVKTYKEALWSELPDVKTVSIEISLALLDALHARWIAACGAFLVMHLKRNFGILHRALCLSTNNWRSTRGMGSIMLLILQACGSVWDGNDYGSAIHFRK